jgi:glycosyltransferase involved in cell wall biosynthesis
VDRHAYAPPVPRSNKIVLVVATLEPRKNGRFLLNWFLHTAALEEDMELWWVGPNGWLEQAGSERARQRGKRRVRFLGMVSDSTLCRLYRQAAFTVYPSLYEGFGFPVLDSLCHDTPVLCAYNSSLQEFAGPGVYYFDPCDSLSLDAAYQEFRRDWSRSIPQQGLRSRYSWDSLAETMLEMCA